MKKKLTASQVVAVLILLIAIDAALAVPFKYVWNYVVPEISTLKVITYPQSLGLLSGVGVVALVIFISYGLFSTNWQCGTCAKKF